MMRACPFRVRFQIEQTFLTGTDGRVAPVVTGSTRLHISQGEDAIGVIRQFVEADGAEIVGDVLSLPGLQAIATVRRKGTVYTLQVLPSSGPIAGPDLAG
jgi:hypothetical protein